ncbi:MAG: hypothetical protein LAN64_19565 [Acidobacteriia bacterium]|nr:hypothetical protein [Terriglobia bacterium]
MSDQPKGQKDHLLKCPLCEGRGELPKQDLLERLNERDLGHKLASYVENFIVADEKAAEPGAADASQRDFKDHVNVWNCTHFLWRRSPKE